MVTGSSARLTASTEGKPTDATVIGIIDDIQLKKQPEEPKSSKKSSKKSSAK
jgi:hypothetical protein